MNYSTTYIVLILIGIACVFIPITLAVLNALKSARISDSTDTENCTSLYQSPVDKKTILYDTHKFTPAEIEYIRKSKRATDVYNAGASLAHRVTQKELVAQLNKELLRSKSTTSYRAIWQSKSSIEDL